MLDSKFTRRLQAYIQADQPDPREGALMLFQLTGRRPFYERAIRAPEVYRPIIFQELKKHLRIRLDGLTRQGVVRFEKESLPRIEATINEGPPVTEDATTTAEDAAPVISSDGERTQTSTPHRGLRRDHQSLPAEIQAIPQRCSERWFKMKALYNRLLLMEDRLPCDRYELLKELRRADDEQRRDWERYDGFSVDGGEAAS